MLTAIETTGTVNAQHQLQLDAELPENTPDRVRVIVLFEDSDIAEREWLNAAANNDAFEFLNDEAEDIYTQADGKPLSDEG
ncbi:MAG: hypothetical protein WBD16_03095 [Pyrinomonadaceae bacterium]